MTWLRLIRWKNLLIVFLTQLLAWGCVIVPMRQYSEVPLLLNTQYFLSLSLSTVLIAAAGYIINDYFDIKIDSINRPEKVILENKVPLKLAIILHTVLNVIAMLLAAVVARRAGHYSWLFMQLGCTILLWFYSTHFKRQFMTGNVIVALLTAFTIIVLMLYETGIHYYITRPYFIQTVKGLIPNPVWVLGVYTYFAFVLTWMREVVKDMEDLKGDAEEGCVTMPIKWGLLNAVRFTQVLGVLVVIPLVIASVRLWMANWKLLSLYTSLALVLPLLAWVFVLQRKATTAHYGNASKWLKIIMVSGIGSLIIYYFQTYA